MVNSDYTKNNGMFGLEENLLKLLFQQNIMSEHIYYAHPQILQKVFPKTRNLYVNIDR